jgi:hypothetical protein
MYKIPATCIHPEHNYYFQTNSAEHSAVCAEMTRDEDKYKPNKFSSKSEVS